MFLYGTLLDPRTLARVAGVPGLAQRLTPAALPDHARVVLRGTPYPTLIRAPGGLVRGAVLRRPGAAAMARLRLYEGGSYRLVPVTVRGPRGPLRCRAWVAPRFRAEAGRSWVPGGPGAAGRT